MEYDLILARSVTYAQRMQRALNRAGIRSQLFRAPRDLTDLGCAYVVRIGPQDLHLAPAGAGTGRLGLCVYGPPGKSAFREMWPMIYLDSAATTFQKPPAVGRAMTEALASMSSPGRAGIRWLCGLRTPPSGAARSWRSCLALTPGERVVFLRERHPRA